MFILFELDKPFEEWKPKPSASACEPYAFMFDTSINQWYANIPSHSFETPSSWKTMHSNFIPREFRATVLLLG